MGQVVCANMPVCYSPTGMTLFDIATDGNYNQLEYENYHGISGTCKYASLLFTKWCV